MSLYTFVLGAMLSLAPGRDHDELAAAVALVAETRPALFADDRDRRKTAALLVAVAFRESSLRLDAVGDGGRARCAFQLWSAPREVLTDAVLCTQIAHDRLRESFKVCGPDNLLGLYAAGPRGCALPKARRISADRLALARRLVGGASDVRYGRHRRTP